MSGKKELIKSASILVLAKSSIPQGQQGQKQDYKLMLLKRNSKMRVAPGFSVFPGGKLDLQVDASPRWREIFDSHDFAQKFPRLITRNSLGTRFTSSTTTVSIPLEIAYRLCAIRETFEETGLLLARNNKNPQQQSSPISDFVDDDKNSKAITDWHDRVLNDSASFIDMFAAMRPLVPDLDGLHEWSNWITPTREKTGVRFDTYFFTCFLPRAPPATSLRLNKQENESLEVINIFSLYKNREIKREREREIFNLFKFQLSREIT